MHTATGQFGMFGDLPPEIRLRIWLLTIPDDEEEVCICWPNGPSTSFEEDAQFQPFDDLPVLPLTVDTAFPAAMHVCRESRALVQNTKLSGVRFRASYVARCMTPFRCFRPELDVLYVDNESVRHLMLLVDPKSAADGRPRLSSEEQSHCDAFTDTLRRVRRLAIQAALGTAFLSGHMNTIYDYLWDHLDGPPEVLSLVFPCSTPYAWSGRRMPDQFAPPGTQCRLRSVPGLAEDEQLQISTYGRKVMTAREVVEEAHRQVEEDCSEDRPGERAMLDALQWRTQVFVERQPDGSWTEACRDRMYAGCHHPGSRDFVPVNRRPNPEMVRVHDADAVFRPAEFGRDPY